MAWVLTLVGLPKPDWSVEGERSNLDPVYTYPDIFYSLLRRHAVAYSNRVWPSTRVRIRIHSQFVTNL